MRVLLVEDDAELSAAIAEFLELQGAECDFAYNGQSGVELAIAESFEIILLDVMLPKLDGFDVCTALRKHGVSTPVLMQTAMGTTEDQINGFRSGVDDFVVKPYPMPLLWERIKALHRRSQNQQAMNTLGPLTIEIENRKLTREGKSIVLTPTGWKILEILLRNSPKVVARPDIERSVWPDEEIDGGRLNVHLHALRKAIDQPFEFAMIKTIIGLGVCISAEQEPDSK